MRRGKIHSQEKGFNDQNDTQPEARHTIKKSTYDQEGEIVSDGGIHSREGIHFHEKGYKSRGGTKKRRDIKPEGLVGRVASKTKTQSSRS